MLATEGMGAVPELGFMQLFLAVHEEHYVWGAGRVEEREPREGDDGDHPGEALMAGLGGGG